MRLLVETRSTYSSGRRDNALDGSRRHGPLRHVPTAAEPKLLQVFASRQYAKCLVSSAAAGGARPIKVVGGKHVEEAH